MIARQARNWKLLGTAFFDVVQKNTALNPCVFNYIRRELTPEEYAAFDDAYCEYRRPGQKGIAKYIRKKEGEKQWIDQKKELSRKMQQPTQFQQISKMLGFNVTKRE